MKVMPRLHLAALTTRNYETWRLWKQISKC